MYKSYLLGKGIDVGRRHTLLDAEYLYREPDNLYLLRNEVGIETYDYLFSHNFINETKYYRILLYEWFLVVKEGGYIIIEFENNEIMDYECLKREINTLVICRDKYRVIEEDIKCTTTRVVIQKTISTKRDENEINQWTFGIVTNGKRKDFVERAINSIRSLNIPQYEIILCGIHNGDIAADVRYIYFTEKDNKGWITKKKNIVCENARYENIVVTHDRVYFDDNWFEGMKKYGNYFDVLSCPVLFYLKGGRIISTNWDTVKDDFKLEDDYKLFHSNGRLDTADWDKNVIISGPLIILKKHIWAIERWNEVLFWGDAEDIEYSHRLYRGGIMLRLNAYSMVHALSVSGIVLHSYYEKDIRTLGEFCCGLPTPLIFVLKMLDFLGFRRNQRAVQYFISKIKKFYGASSWKEEADIVK